MRDGGDQELRKEERRFSELEICVLMEFWRETKSKSRERERRE